MTAWTCNCLSAHSSIHAPPVAPALRTTRLSRQNFRSSMPTSSPFEQQLQQQRSTVAPAAAGMQSAAATNGTKDNGNATQGYIVKELSVTADLIDSFVQDEAKQEPAASLAQQAWIKSLIDSSGGKVVFSAEGDGHAMAQHLRCVCREFFMAVNWTTGSLLGVLMCSSVLSKRCCCACQQRP